MTAVHEFTREYAGCPEAVGEARAWVAGCVAGCPEAEAAVLCTSEAASNAVMFTTSGKGGKFTVRVVHGGDRVRIEVTDQGGPTVPVVRPLTDRAEGGRGLAIVEALAAGWGVTGGEAGRCVWMEFPWPGAGRPAWWVRVMGRAGWRCQCTGQCGQPHDRHSPDGRCLAEHPGRELHAVPAWPVSATRAARLPSAALIAMCATCHDRRDRRTARRQGAAPAVGEDLFGGERR